MSDLGVFAVDRGVFSHALFERDTKREPFSRLEAWLWMLAEASWKERPRDIGGRIVRLQRGQFAHSVRFMAEAWGWSKSAVARFLGRLETEAMIGTASGTAVSIITICNYDAYQRVSLPSGTATGTASGTAAGQQRDKREDIQTFKEEDMSETAVPDTDPSKSRRRFYPEDFEEAWKAYPTDANMSKAKALEAWKRLTPEDRALVIPSIPGFIDYCRANQTYRPVHFVRYLSERRFEGFTSQTDQPADWSKRLQFARQNGVWSSAQWGPMPGRDGCLVPPDLILPADGLGWREYERSAA